MRVAEAVGLPGARATLAQLRRVPASAFEQLEGQGLSLAPSFVVGDAAVPVPILTAFQNGRQAAVPLIIGSNSDDASVALAFGLKPEAIVKQLGAARIQVGLMYPGVLDDAELGRQAVRDVALTAFARRIAYLQSSKAPTWRYYYSHVEEAAASGRSGAPHGIEVPAVFGTAELCNCLAAQPTPNDRALLARVEER